VHLLIASILIVAGDEFRMLDELRGVAGNSRDQDLPGGEFHVAPDFVLVTDVAALRSSKPSSNLKRCIAR
jgi:hypothetical protein